MLAGIGGLAAGAILAGHAQAGPLNPPPGPIAPTPGPEPRIAINSTNTPGDADSLFKISQPGSYYLTQNVTGVASRHGIEIAASRVTIDLNGFQLAGIAGSRHGIATTASGLTDIEICNGTVTGWGESGIDTSSVNTQNSVIRNIRSNMNAQRGLDIGAGSLIEGCTVHNNLSGGVDAQNRCIIARTTAHNNTGRGIATAFTSVVTECVSTENTTDGIAINGGSVVNRCSVVSNTGNGIFVSSGGIVENCNCRNNLGDGILVSGLSTVANNSCVFNGNGSTGAGVHATGENNRIEGNQCSGNVRNFDIDIAGNFIVRNTASAVGNTVVNWDIAAGNTVLIISAATSFGVFGDSGGSSPGSTNPNANYTY
ncbi:MAG: right-handed parallel beta-helix repeat-containing protein [Phycisphaerales bacterium]